MGDFFKSAEILIKNDKFNLAEEGQACEVKIELKNGRLLVEFNIN